LDVKAFEGDIDYLQVLDENGKLDTSLLPKEVDDNMIIDMYKRMLYVRAVDAKILSLQRQGRAVTYAPLLGEEATQIGTALAMGGNDIFVPAFRQHAVYLTRGLPLETLLIYWRGYEEGNAIPKDVKGMANVVPVATQMPHASGIAYAQRYLKTGAAVVAYVGDGGTSEGDFYEALNFAGVWSAPLVVIIENNQWAISMPRKKQTVAQTLAQKAIAAGIPGMQVDGNDVIGVYKATKDALANTKDGPTVIECITYRMGIHTTADDPTKYRDQEEVDFWAKRDPLLRVRNYLTAHGLWSDDIQSQAEAANMKTIDEAVNKAEAFKPDPKLIFTSVYSYMPDILQQEMDAAVAANFWQDQSE
jgi:pyruvate dehydrogenase E1 component alpha subunit